MNIVIRKIQEIIKNTKFDNKVYIAGGFVRDYFMNKSSKDIDLVVIGLGLNAGIELAEFLCKNINLDHKPIIFSRFGTAQIKIFDINIEIVAARKEIYNFKNRMPEVFEGTLEDDINRRDFSINSILYNISQKSFIDLKNGIKDIKDGIIRTTSNPKIIFAEDPLRIMRAIRFAAQLGFKIEENTFNNIIKFVPWLKNISNERIRDEFNKILISKYFVDGINYLNYSGILSYMISEFSKFDSIQNEDCKWHTKNLFNHTLEVMTRVPATIEHRLAALLHDVGKVNTMTINNTGIHFYQHQFHSQRIAKNFMIHYKYTNKQIEWISNSIMMHMNFIEKMSEKTIRKMINKYGKEQFLFFLDLAMADSLRPERKYIVQSIIDFVNTNKYIPEVITKMPVNGDMIMKRYNLKPSKIVGELLAIEKEFLFEFPEANEFEIYYILDNKIVNNK